MKERILVDITAAMEYVKQHVEEKTMNYANKHMEEYNSTHKRKVKEPTVDNYAIFFEGLMFEYCVDVNGYKYCYGNNMCLPIDDFIVKE